MPETTTLETTKPETAMLNTTAIDLVAFDMAGTTIDEHGLVYDALRDSVLETGATVADTDLQQWMGTDKIVAITNLIRLGGGKATEPGNAVESGKAKESGVASEFGVATDSVVAAAFERFRAILAESYRANPPVALPGVEAALRELKSRGIRVSLTTGFSDDVALPLLASLGWSVGSGKDDLLDAVVTTSDVAAGRPAPYLIHTAMQRTGVTDVRRVLAAGDTVVDLQAAHNAGVIGVGVLTGALDRAALEPQPNHYILDSVADIPQLAETQPAKH